VSVRELALKILLQGNLVPTKAELVEDRAQPFSEKAVTSRELEEELRGVWGDHVLNPLGHVFGARIKVALRERFNAVVDIALATATDRDRIFVAFSNSFEDLVNVVE
jgi:hypothetical protein